MESHTSNRAHSKEKSPAIPMDIKNNQSELDPGLQATLAIAKAKNSSMSPEKNRELSPALMTLLAIAKARYSSYMQVAQKFDDSQEVFSSKMEHFLEACDRTSQAALYTANTSKNQ